MFTPQIYLSLLLLIVLQWSSYGQAYVSLRTQNLIQETQKKKQSLSKGTTMREQKVSVLLTVSPKFDKDALITLGVDVNLHLGNVITARMFPSLLEQVAQLKGVQFVQANEPVYKRLNVATPSIGVGKAHSADEGLQQAFTGKNTVVGVIDFDFDYTHPSFYDKQGNTRILAVWNQNDESGSNTGMQRSYGTVYYTQEEFEQKRCSGQDGSHGTHVAGIAAGNGGEHANYTGVAPEAKLVLVQLGYATNAEILDAIDFIFALAQSKGMPAVINLSLGTHWGPHDGTSAFDVSLDKLVGKGKIAVGAAGNEGNKNLHASYVFTNSNNTMRTIIDPTSNYAVAMAWSEPNTVLEWNVEIWDRATKTKLHTANPSFLSTQKGQTTNHNFTHNGTILSYNANSYNNYADVARGIVEIEITNPNPSKYGIALVLKAADGTVVHLWSVNANSDSNGDFSALSGTSDRWISGDNAVTIGEIGSTAKNIISVGATVSKQEYINLSGNKIRFPFSGTLNGIARFSSRGPTADNRIKPDVVAPGSYIISAVNSCDFYNASSYNVVIQEHKNAQTYYMASLEGTSMSSPMVAGAIALLLEACPNLTPDSVRNILQRTTTLEPLIANEEPNTRGAGVVNIHKALLQKQNAVCDTIDRIPLSAFKGEQWSKRIDFSIHPNPNNGQFYIKSNKYTEKQLTLRVYNTLGTLLFTQEITTEQYVSLPLPRGLYIVQIQNKKMQGAKKMLVYN
ncbi:MAG: S8 family serine peptidase [Bacteroidales bacterium]